MSLLGAIKPTTDASYHYRDIEFADGVSGQVYGDKDAGPEDPYLLLLDYLMEAGELVSYIARPKKSGDGTLVWINIDKKIAAQRLQMYRDAAKTAATGAEPPYVAPPEPVVVPASTIPPPAAKKAPEAVEPDFPAAPKKVPMPPPASAAVVAPPPAVVTPPQATVTPPPAAPAAATEEPPVRPGPPPTTPPGEKFNQKAHPAEDDPFFGYGNRNLMLDAKDHYFRALEKYKMQRDISMDREFSFRAFLEAAVSIVKDNAKKLPPGEAADVAWDLAINFYNRYQDFRFKDGKIERPEEAGQPA